MVILRKGVDSIKEICFGNNWEILALEVDKDHLHILLEYDTVESISNIVKKLKQEFTQGFVKEIIAFANTDGGIIYIGFADDGEVVGVDDPHLVIERISSLIRDGIYPDLISLLEISEQIVDEKPIIRIKIQSGTHKPYYLSSKRMTSSRVYVRHGISSVPASAKIIRELIIESYGFFIGIMT